MPTSGVSSCMWRLCGTLEMLEAMFMQDQSCWPGPDGLRRGSSDHGKRATVTLSRGARGRGSAGFLLQAASALLRPGTRVMCSIYPAGRTFHSLLCWESFLYPARFTGNGKSPDCEGASRPARLRWALRLGSGHNSRQVLVQPINMRERSAA